MTAQSVELKQRPYWWDTAAGAAAEPRPLPSKVDVAVIGGGITGLSAARALVRRGVNAAVLEAQTIGWGASSRNGGMVLTGLKLGASTLIARHERALARQLFNASVAAVDRVERLVSEERIDCDFMRCGHLSLACKPAHYEHFVSAAQVLSREFAHKVRPVARTDLRGEIRTSVVEMRAYVDERLQTSTVEMRRHFEVVGESLRGDIRAVAEGVALLSQRVDRGFAEQAGRTDGLEGRVVRLEVRVLSLEDNRKPPRPRRRR